MIDLKNGNIVFDNGFVLSSKLAFEDFKNSQYYNGQQTGMIIDIDDIVVLSGEKFYLSVIFDADRLRKVFLMIHDPSVIDYSDEPKRKLLHDKFLKSIGVQSEMKYDWGSIGSYYDEKGAGNYIIIVYK
ncbi:MAG: hypothetical protein ACC608_00630 [Anaerofustis sp.]